MACCLQTSFRISLSPGIKQWRDFVHVGYAVLADVMKLGCFDILSDLHACAHALKHAKDVVRLSINFMMPCHKCSLKTMNQ